MGFVPEDDISPKFHGSVHPRTHELAKHGSVQTGHGDRRTIELRLPGVQVVGKKFAVCFSTEYAPHTPGIDIRLEASLVGRSNHRFQAGGVVLKVVLAEGMDDVRAAVSNDVRKVAVNKVLWNTITKVADSSLHAAPS